MYQKPRRLHDFDYAQPLIAHVILCTHLRQPLLGTLGENSVHLSPGGESVQRHLEGFTAYANGATIDTFIVMPDHIHAIVLLGADSSRNTTPSLSTVMGLFKKRVLADWKTGVTVKAWTPYHQHLWQKSYRDTLIRSTRHLDITRNYILDNPARAIARAKDQPW